MALTKGKLGQFIELRDVRNSDLKYGVDDVRGVNIAKQMMSTKADLTSRDLSKFQIVAPEEFVFNHRTSRNGSKFSIAFNDSKTSVICTEDYVVFRISEYGRKYIVPEWLYMFFNRPEFDRYVITNSWGSSTEFYNWEDICDVDMELPPITVQQKYVDLYISMLNNQRCYEAGLDDLRISCIANIEKLKKTVSSQSIMPYIEERCERNDDVKYNDLIGVGNDGFITPRGNRVESTFYKCNIFYPGDFVYNPSVICNGAIAYNTEFTEPKICTEEYVVFYVKDKNVLSSEYLFLWLKREETGRYLNFLNIDSVRNRVHFEDLVNICIPIPDIQIQNSISAMFTAYNKRKIINERLKNLIKDLCPILIKGAVEEGARS